MKINEVRPFGRGETSTLSSLGDLQQRTHHGLGMILQVITPRFLLIDQDHFPGPKIGVFHTELPPMSCDLQLSGGEKPP